MFLAWLVPVIALGATCRTFIGLLLASALIGVPSWQFFVITVVVALMSGPVVAGFLQLDAISGLLIGAWFSVVHLGSVVFYTSLFKSTARKVEANGNSRESPSP